MNVSGAASPYRAIASSPATHNRSAARAASPSGNLQPKIGSGRPPQLRGLHALLALSMTGKMGFREVSAADLPEKAREELNRKVNGKEAVSIFAHPGTGEFRVVVQNENDREKVNVYSWRNDSWATLL